MNESFLIAVTDIESLLDKCSAGNIYVWVHALMARSGEQKRWRRRRRNEARNNIYMERETKAAFWGKDIY